MLAEAARRRRIEVRRIRFVDGLREAEPGGELPEEDRISVRAADKTAESRLALAEACQHEPAVDDDRSARDAGTLDAPGSRGQAALDPTDRRRDLEPDRLLVRFANPDRAREGAATEPGRSDMGTGERGTVSSDFA